MWVGTVSSAITVRRSTITSRWSWYKGLEIRSRWYFGSFVTKERPRVWGRSQIFACNSVSLGGKNRYQRKLSGLGWYEESGIFKPEHCRHVVFQSNFLKWNVSVTHFPLWFTAWSDIWYVGFSVPRPQTGWICKCKRNEPFVFPRVNHHESRKRNQ